MPGIPFFFGQGQAQTGLDVAGAVDQVVTALNASSAADLVFWTTAELYQFADEAAKRMARLQGGFVERDASGAVVADQAAYTLPARHLSTIHVSVAGAGLRERTVQELEALDDDWPDTTAAAPASWLNVNGLDTMTFYPKPSTAAGAIGIVFHRYPPTVAEGSADVDAPRCLQGYFHFHMMAEALAKESKAAKPEVAQWARQMGGLYERVCREYWGGAQ